MKIDYFPELEPSMPRHSSSTSSSFSPSKSTSKSRSLTPALPLLNSGPKSLIPYSAPSSGQTLKDSLVSGVGSGIGFGIGNRLVSSLFGASAPVSTISQVGSSQSPTVSTSIPNLQQCYQNALDASDKPLCYALLSKESNHYQFKQCMESSENQIHLCKEFLPST